MGVKNEAVFALTYVWFPENTKKKKKYVKENDFLIFSYLIKNIKENQI